MLVDLTVRHVPRPHWVRLVLATDATIDAGHAWIYAGIVRRDAWRLGPLGLAVLRLPRSR